MKTWKQNISSNASWPRSFLHKVFTQSLISSSCVCVSRLAICGFCVSDGDDFLRCAFSRQHGGAEAVTGREVLCETKTQSGNVKWCHKMSREGHHKWTTLHTLRRAMTSGTGSVRDIWRGFFHSPAKGCLEATGICNATQVPATSLPLWPRSFFPVQRSFFPVQRPDRHQHEALRRCHESSGNSTDISNAAFRWFVAFSVLIK